MRKIDILENRLDEMLRVYPSFPPPWFTREFNNLVKELTHELERLAIREAAFEEAARWCEAYIDRLHELRDNDESLPMYQPELAGRQAGAARCAAGIRGLK